MAVIPYAAIRKLKLSQSLTNQDRRALRLMRGIRYASIRGK